MPLVVVRLAPTLVRGPAGERWVKICPSVNSVPGWAWHHASTAYALFGIRAPRMNDGPAFSISLMWVSGVIPASATAVTSAQSMQGLERLHAGTIVNFARRASALPDYSGVWVDVSVCVSAFGGCGACRWSVATQLASRVRASWLGDAGSAV